MIDRVMHAWLDFFCNLIVRRVLFNAFEDFVSWGLCLMGLLGSPVLFLALCDG